MDAQKKCLLISEAREKFAEKIRSLEFIKKNDNCGLKSKDGLSIFRPHNMLTVKDKYFRPREAMMTVQERIDSNASRKPENILWGFKYKADQHIGYILENVRVTEPMILKSGKPSKNKTVEKFYIVVASYNFSTNNVELNILDDSYKNSMESLAYAETPEKFIETYKQYAKEFEKERRAQKMTVTVGIWEDMLNEIKKLSNRIDALENNLSENYTKRYNSQEE